MPKRCSHTGSIRRVTPASDGCQECLRSGGSWVHLRVCLTCGHVGCCDSSPNRHATQHYLDTGHPLVKPLDTDEGWVWCYVDQVAVIAPEPDDGT